MKINLPISLINKYLDTMELNEQVASFYNDYFNYFNDYEFNNEISLYSYIKECLEIDENDTYFKNFEKEYELNNIKELDIKKYKNDAYIKGIRLREKIKCKGYTLDFSKYDPYYLFIYDEIKVNKNEYYRETYDVGYFKDSFTYIELNKNNITWMSTIPHEINTMKKDIDIVKNNVLVLGLGIGYFSYLISNKASVKTITILENDEEILSLFTKFIMPNYKYKDKVKIIKCDALEYLKNHDLSIFDYIYVDLYHNANDGISFYYYIKNIENKLNCNSKFLYWIETNILCLIRRITLSIIRDNIYCKNYEKKYNSLKDNEFNNIVKTIFNNINCLTISSKNELDSLLSDDSLKKLIINCK